MNIFKEEMNIYGYTKLGIVPPNVVQFLRNDLLERKQKEIDTFGQDYLRKNGYLDLIRNSFRFHPIWVALLEDARINNFIDTVLNPTAVLHDSFCLLNTDGSNPALTRNRFHRDQPWFKDTRTSIAVFVFLTDIDDNGPTEIVPSTHLFKDQPSEEFLEQHKVALTGPAGQMYAIDAALWHRAGVNHSGGPRPLLNLRYQLAFLKRPIDLCEAYKKDIENASELLKLRLGWHCRSYDNAAQALAAPDRWGKGQYNTDNIHIQ